MHLGRLDPRPLTHGPVSHRWLMHAKYLHEISNLLMHIPTYYNIISCYNHDL
jgi:hypothetical protein